MPFLVIFLIFFIFFYNKIKYTFLIIIYIDILIYNKKKLYVSFRYIFNF